MGVLLAEREKRTVQHSGYKIYPTTKTASGSEWTKIVTAVSVEPSAYPDVGHNTFTLLSNATERVSFCTVSYANVADYNSDFVSEMLAADAADPEAAFDNVVDMLDWLNR